MDKEREELVERLHDDPVRAALLFCLWHHQGWSSRIGQAIRLQLGIGAYEHLSDDQLATAKAVQAALTAQQEPVAHPDDAAIDKFAAAMKAKMAKKRAEGRSGWDDPEQCTIDYLTRLFHDHVCKGDPVDIGNFAMMLWHRISDTSLPAQYRRIPAPQPTDGVVVPSRAEILGALARGYCHEGNTHKQMDADLLNMQADELVALLAAAKEPLPKGDE